MEDSKFNIRVYAIFLYRKSVLLSHEYFKAQAFTKFPGGGLKFGEGTHDCLRREIREELNQEIREIRHFYTLDFFQPTRFYKDYQLLTIYYLACLQNPDSLSITSEFKAKDQKSNGLYRLRWVPLDQFQKEDLTFTADQEAAGKLLNSYKKGELLHFNCSF